MVKNKEIVKDLGEGSFSSVELVKITETDGTLQYFAMKSVHSWNYEYIDKEIQILSKLRGCPGVVQCCGEKLQEDVIGPRGYKIYRMFLEYAEGGSLESLMDEYVDRRLPDQMIRKFTRMILEGLVSIHSHRYIHCDLKPGNILVFPRIVSKDGHRSRSYEVKITDFGLSREIGEEDDWWEPKSPFWASPHYMSPESVKEGKIGEALDIWSLGCLVLEMYTGEPPWPFEEDKDIMDVLMDDNIPEIPESVPLAARKFLETCFARNPDERGSALEMLSHQFFHGVECESGMLMPLSVERETETKPGEAYHGLQQQEALQITSCC